MCTKNNSFIKKIVFSSIIILCSSGMSLVAQSNIQVLDETSMRAMMDANKMNGKPSYQGINSKLVITTNDVAVSKNDSAQIVKNILNLQDVFSCVFLPSKHSLVVKSKKQDASYKIIAVKGELTPFKLYITQNEEIIYTEKK